MLLLLVLLVLWFVGLGTGFIQGEIRIGFSLFLLGAPPVALYYLKKKTVMEDVTVEMDSTQLHIRWPKEKQTILFNEIKSYSADHMKHDERYDVESVRIRLKNGEKVRLYATSNLGDIKPLGKFRMDFDTLARGLGIKSQFWGW